MSKPNPESDPQFAAIELTAAQTDRLTELFQDMKAKLDTVVELVEKTEKNVLVLKVQQEDLASEQESQTIKLNKIDGTIKAMDRKIDAIGDSVEIIRQNTAGAVSAAKSALDAATKPRIRKVSGLDRR